MENYSEFLIARLVAPMETADLLTLRHNKWEDLTLLYFCEPESLEQVARAGIYIGAATATIVLCKTDSIDPSVLLKDHASQPSTKKSSLANLPRGKGHMTWARVPLSDGKRINHIVDAFKLAGEYLAA